LEPLYREIAILKKMDHPNIVKLIEVAFCLLFVSDIKNISDHFFKASHSVQFVYLYFDTHAFWDDASIQKLGIE